MKSSKTRILTTHVGSLPRPEKLVSMLVKQDKGEPYNASELSKFVSSATKEIVKQQIKTGIDIINDGEAGKISYHVYAKHRLTGLENVTGQGVPGRPLPRDIKDFPEMVPKPLGGGVLGLELGQLGDVLPVCSFYDPVNFVVLAPLHCSRLVGQSSCRNRQAVQ